MFRKCIFCVLILLLHIIGLKASDDLYFIRSSTYLYSLPQEESEKSGVFARGGHLKKLEVVNDDWWKVKAENQMIGYVKVEYVWKHLNAADSYGADPDVFIQNDGYMGCPHLFIRAASLRARKLPDASAKVDKVLFTNTPVCVGFLPYNEDGWVNIGGFFEETRSYIQRKYLGERFELDRVIQLYNNLGKQDVTSRKLWVERLAEMGWLENLDDRVRALEICYEFWKEQNDSMRIKDMEFELFRAKAMQNPIDPEEFKNYFRPDDTYIVLNHVKTHWFFTLSGLEAFKIPFEKKTDLGDENMCSSADYQLISKTSVLNVYIMGQEQKIEKASILSMDLSVDGNAFVINNFKIDKNTTERAFVTNVGRLIYVYHTNPHVYYINIDEASFISITFKDGMPSLYEEIPSC